MKIIRLCWNGSNWNVCVILSSYHFKFLKSAYSFRSYGYFKVEKMRRILGQEFLLYMTSEPLLHLKGWHAVGILNRESVLCAQMEMNYERVEVSKFHLRSFFIRLHFTPFMEEKPLALFSWEKKPLALSGKQPEDSTCPTAQTTCPGQSGNRYCRTLFLLVFKCFAFGNREKM